MSFFFVTFSSPLTKVYLFFVKIRAQNDTPVIALIFIIPATIIMERKWSYSKFNWAFAKSFPKWRQMRVGMACIVANFLTKMMSSLLHLNFCQSMHISGLRPSPFSPAWFLPITVINLQIDYYRVQQCFAYVHHWGSQVKKECRTCCNSQALLLCNPLLFLTSLSINRSRLKKITRLPVHCRSLLYPTWHFVGLQF